MNITEKEYRNNLLFYTILKDLLKCQLSEKKLMILQESIEQNNNLSCKKMKQLLSNDIVKESTRAYDDLMILLNLANDGNYNMWKEIDKYYGQKDVCIPILGSGVTRINGISLTQQELLDLIIYSYKLSPYKIKVPYKLYIICKKKDNFSLNKIGETL